MEAFKFNFTKKELARKLLEEERKEKESQKAMRKVLSDLDIPIY